MTLDSGVLIHPIQIRMGVPTGDGRGQLAAAALWTEQVRRAPVWDLTRESPKPGL